MMIALLAAGVATFGELYAIQGVLTEVARAFHTSAAGSAITVSAGTTGLACGVFAWTAVADRLGRLNAMRISVLGSVLLSALATLAPGFSLIVGLRFLCGMFLGGVPVLAVAYVFESLRGARAAAAATAYISGTTLGGAFGRLTAGPLAPVLGWRGALLAVSFACLVAAILFAVLAPQSPKLVAERSPQLPKIVTALRTTALRRLYLQSLLLTGCFVAVYNFLAFRLEAPPVSLSPVLASLIFITYLSGTFSSRLAGRWLGRFGAQRTILIGLATILIGLAVLCSSAVWLMIIGLVIFTGGFFLAHATAVAMTGQIALPEHRSQASALYNVHFYVGSGVGGWALGLVFVQFGWVGMSAAIALLVVIIGVVVATGSCAGHGACLPARTSASPATTG